MIEICQVCNELNEVEIYLATKMCTSCREKEEVLQKESDEKADGRIDAQVIPDEQVLEIDADGIVHDMGIQPASSISQEKDLNAAGLDSFIEENKIQVDTTARIREDIFNAETTSIVKMKEEIDADDTIERKHFALAIRVTELRNHLRKVLFDVNDSYNKTIQSINSEIRSQQQYLNDLANKLRENEREAIKARDIAYKPTPPKATKTPRVAKKKFDKKELKRYSDLLGGNMEYTLQMLCVANNMQPDKAYEMIKGMQGDKS